MTADHNVAGAKMIGDLQDFARLASFVADGLNLVEFQAQDADHAAGDRIGSGLHRAATFLHQFQAIFKGDCFGEDQGRVFTEAEPRSGLSFGSHFRLGRFERLERGQAADEQRGLAVDGGIELFSRSVEADLGIAFQKQDAYQPPIMRPAADKGEGCGRRQSSATACRGCR